VAKEKVSKFQGCKASE